MDCGSSWTLLRVTTVAVVYVGRAQVAARCAGGRQGLPTAVSPSLAGCFAAILPSFLSVRGCNSPETDHAGKPRAHLRSHARTLSERGQRLYDWPWFWCIGVPLMGRSPAGRGSRRGEASRTKRAQHPNGSHAIASNRRPRNVDARRTNIGGCASGPSSAEARPRPGGNCNGVSSRSFRRR